MIPLTVLKKYPCNIVAYHTTRKLIMWLNLPLYWKGIYLPHLLLMPFFTVWMIIGIIIIFLFGGLFLLCGKEQKLIRIWLKD